MKVPKYIAQQYFIKRQNAKKQQQEHINIINSITDQIKIINDEITDIAFSYGQNITNINSQSRLETINKTDFLENQKREILQSLGFVPDYLDIKYECPICKDTGYTDELKQNMCSCMKKAIYSYNLSLSGVRDDQTFESNNFDVFKDPKHKNRAINLYNAAIKYVNDLPNPSPINFLIFGKTGSGKTYLLNCIAHRSIEKNINVGFFTAYTIIDLKLKSINHDSPAEDFTSYELLIIDDLGSEPMLNNITTELLFKIINEREIRNLPTVIATNLTLDELQDNYDERIYSRISSPLYNSVYEFIGRDLRLE